VRVSAIVCTRNRPGPVAEAVRWLLDDTDPGLELIVVDQSDGSDTENALAAWRNDPRFRYLRSARRGKGAALNDGLAVARASIVAFTDDDCRVPPGWAVAMAKVLESHPSAAIAFCRVAAVPHDVTLGYVPAYDPPGNRLLRSITQVRNGLGLGAAMALRKDFAVSMGGFDESFGPGGRFPTGDEWDISIRALLKGWHVYETRELSVIHDGFRTFAEGRQHARRDWIALGAVCAKPLRAGYLRAVVVPLWFFSARALWPPLASVLRLRRPKGFGRIAGFVQGFADGMMTDVDPVTLLYVGADLNEELPRSVRHPRT
jgi:glycosyltransferase involved in cell wall biosynthesis